MICSFCDSDTQALSEGKRVRSFPPDILKRARRKLAILNAATSIQDLRSPPGNHLERLSGNRAEQYSIRVNKQYRICFVWRDGKAHQVELTDYH